MFLTILRLTHWGLRILDAHASDALGRYEVLQIKTLLNGVTKEKCVQIFLTLMTCHSQVTSRFLKV
jgi:hypothetical protein